MKITSPFFIILLSLNLNIADAQISNNVPDAVKDFKKENYSYNYFSKLKFFDNEDTLSAYGRVSSFLINGDKVKYVTEIQGRRNRIVLVFRDSTIVLDAINKFYFVEYPKKKPNFKHYHFKPITSNAFWVDLTDTSKYQLLSSSTYRHSYRMIGPSDFLNIKDIEFSIDSISNLPVEYKEAFYDKNYRQFQAITVDFNLRNNGIYFDSISFQACYSSLINYKRLENKLHISEQLTDSILNDQWTANSMDGGKISLENIKTKLTLIDFWYAGCLPCLKGIKDINYLNEKYADENLTVLGMNVLDSDTNKIRKVMNNYKINYNILINAKSIAQQYRVSGYPTYILLDQHKKVIYVKTGHGENTLSELINAINNGLQ